MCSSQRAQQADARRGVMTAVALPRSVQSLPDLIALMCPAYSCWNLGNMVDKGIMVPTLIQSVHTYMLVYTRQLLGYNVGQNACTLPLSRYTLCQDDTAARSQKPKLRYCMTAIYINTNSLAPQGAYKPTQSHALRAPLATVQYIPQDHRWSSGISSRTSATLRLPGLSAADSLLPPGSLLLQLPPLLPLAVWPPPAGTT